MGAAFRRSIPLTAPPTTKSGVHARVRDYDDEATVVTDVHERDTVPPPATTELDDVHGRETVNRKISPEFLAYLRSFDAAPAAPVADPATPQPWSSEARDDQPEIEVGESFDDEETLLALPPGVLPASVPPSSLQPSMPLSAEAEADEEIPSFRDSRAIACVVAILSAVAGAIATVFVMT